MADTVGKLWQTVQGWFSQQAQHVTVTFLPDDGAEPVVPNAGYTRLWLSEGFLAQQRTWGANQFPALHGGVRLSFAGSPPSPFSTFTRPPQEWAVPGAQLDFPLTTLLPFTGGTVEMQAALYRASNGGPLGTAIQLVTGLGSLLGPPLATAAAIAGKLSDALDGVLAGAGEQPVLGVHWTVIAPGGGGQVLRPGHLVVLNRPAAELDGSPIMDGGRLHLATRRGPALPTGVDYLVLRVECRTERDDWRLPELDELIRAAGEAFIRGHQDTYADRRAEALVRAWNNTDLVAADRKRVALLVKEELDGLAELGAVPGPDRTLDVAARQRLPALDDDRLSGLTLTGLLA